MGRSYRTRPKRLGEKLRLIRIKLGLSQSEMVKELGVKGEPLYPASISLYENGKREPPLGVLLRYARLAGVSTDRLIDDKLDVFTGDRRAIRVEQFLNSHF
ncbi:MAG TPA: helix-turn-helix transcriptional regulator [Pyrinomonadaceae bacterium]|nr:helix-turn-helix transcriptional regulator [Pyrinomonadaceae bacterium]